MIKLLLFLSRVAPISLSRILAAIVTSVTPIINRIKLKIIIIPNGVSSLDGFRMINGRIDPPAVASPIFIPKVIDIPTCLKATRQQNHPRSPNKAANKQGK
ncbi:hypothetical protein [Francisella sp. 19X1-34]|uniref:hypothetical protein n=1 Tax=Francisella sp. 19X1-34 TaxID=3087177 RepID=UPI002E35B92C|nr:hypothetical protein [Francisella sp. 19X1-34]MED7788418.1 hypothetical protein [Francisella sp. 19X1-34]